MVIWRSAESMEQTCAYVLRKSRRVEGGSDVKKQRILVVEDDRIIARSLRMILEQLGYEVTALASTGQAAINEAKETKPDLILMDIILDGAMDGIEAAEVIRSHLSIPLIYLTAHSDHATRERVGRDPAFRLSVKTHYEG